eukprot:3934481-Rhodomonas_salina.2
MSMVGPRKSHLLAELLDLELELKLRIQRVKKASCVFQVFSFGMCRNISCYFGSEVLGSCLGFFKEVHKLAVVTGDVEDETNDGCKERSHAIRVEKHAQDLPKEPSHAQTPG